jgi:hypothetical protein
MKATFTIKCKNQQILALLHKGYMHAAEKQHKAAMEKGDLYFDFGDNWFSVVMLDPEIIKTNKKEFNSLRNKSTMILARPGGVKFEWKEE